jgi:DNA end-binding protein Ku
MPAPTSTRTTWKGAISFGLVHIPIALHSATQDTRPKMHMIDKKTNAPVGHKNYDKSTGKDIAQEDIVKGLETEKGHFVVLSKEEIQEALPRTTGTIGIEQFVRQADIPLAYYEKPYYVSPAAKGGKPYALLREVLKRTERVGLGKIVLSNKQHLAIVAPHENALILLLLRWEAEVRDTAGLPLPGTIKDEGISERELKMGENLVLELDAPWDPKQYHDEYVEKLDRVVEAKKKAGDVKTLTGIVEDEIVPGQGADIVDLTELLRRSLRGKTASAERSAANDEPAAPKRKRTAAANDAAHPTKKAAATKSGGKAAAAVKPARRKRA